MKKKTLSMLLITTLLLSGCGNANVKEDSTTTINAETESTSEYNPETETHPEETESENQFANFANSLDSNATPAVAERDSDGQIHESDFEYEKYRLISDDSHYIKCILIIKNYSKKDVDVTCNFVPQDQDGNKKDAHSVSYTCLPSGESACLVTTFEYNEAYEYNSLVQFSESYMTPVTNEMEYSETVNAENVVATCKYTGSDTVYGPAVTAIFFKDGNVVDDDFDYINDNSQLQPNTEYSTALYSDKPFDDYQIFYNAYK